MAAKDEQNQDQALWLNFWASNSQRALIEAVASKYDLSPRLAGGYSVINGIYKSR